MKGTFYYTTPRAIYAKRKWERKRKRSEKIFAIAFGQSEHSLKRAKANAKTNFFFDVYRLFFDLFRFRLV